MRIGVMASVVAAGIQAQPVPHPLGPVIATTTAVGYPAQTVGLSGGRVLVNDAARRQLVLLDSTLGNSKVVLDSTRGRANSYGTAGILMTFRGDSALFFNADNRALFVIDSAGGVARTMAAAPLANTGIPIGYSATLGLISLIQVSPIDRYPPSMRPPGEAEHVIRYNDSLLVVAVDLATRRVDTLFRMSTGEVITRTLRTAVSGVSRAPALYPDFDQLVIRHDGAPTMLRAHDYQLEWVNPDRTHTVSAKIPFNWHHVTAEERSRIVASVNAGRQRAYDSTLAQWVSDSAAGRIALTRTTTLIGPSGARVPTTVAVKRPAPPAMAQPSEVPDNLPPVERNAVTADGENRVWIRPILEPGRLWSEGWPHDVVDHTGALVDRVLIPATRRIVGFGPGVVYLQSVDRTTYRLEAARLR